MKVIIQRTTEASVKVNSHVTGQVGLGFVLLVGVTHDDTEDDVNYIVNKIVNLRVFEDQDGKMNLSVKDVGGSVLSISQFTLYADTRKGRRPSFVKAAKPDFANQLYNHLNQLIENEGIKVETGQFGAMMDVQLINDGPVTIILDSQDK